MRPAALAPNVVPRAYRGGEALAAFRRSGAAAGPEDWVGSATTVRGEPVLGLAVLPDGRCARDAFAEDPAGWFGPEHAAAHGGDPALLVKLLDAGERLPVHAHPARAFARDVLGEPYGKTEAWIVVEAEDGAAVHIGFRDAVSPAALARWVREQDRAALLDALHRVPVRPGDAVFVPGGVPHAIGGGIFLVELQEPSDLGVILEHEGFTYATPDELHLGLGYEVALGAVLQEAFDPARDGATGPPRPLGPGVEALLPEPADAFFRAERVRPDPVAPLDASFSILVALRGSGWLEAGGEQVPVAAGDALLVPFAAGETRLGGELEAIRCRPPAP